MLDSPLSNEDERIRTQMDAELSEPHYITSKQDYCDNQSEDEHASALESIPQCTTSTSNVRENQRRWTCRILNEIQLTPTQCQTHPTAPLPETPSNAENAELHNHSASYGLNECIE